MIAHGWRCEISIIAWDGKTFAADKRAVIGGGLIRTTTKIFRVGDDLVGYAGDADMGEEMLYWFKKGADPEKFPAGQRSSDNWGGLLVITRYGDIRKYERTPHPICFAQGHFAIGSGREFAIAAMYLGKTAEEAVRVACEFDPHCGNGVDWMRHDGAFSIDCTAYDRL